MLDANITAALHLFLKIVPLIVNLIATFVCPITRYTERKN